VTSTELERLVRDKMNAAGLSQVIDEHKSQFLEFPDGLFAELVLKDGSQLVDVERIMRESREFLAKQGVELDSIVRAMWTVQNIDDPRPAVGVSGGIRAAWAFPVTLVAGGATTQTEVDVTYSAILEIRNKLVRSSDKSLDEKTVMKEVVREFLKLELSLGGESYWDPIRYPQRELNEAALLYLLMHSPVGKK